MSNDNDNIITVKPDTFRLFTVEEKTQIEREAMVYMREAHLCSDTALVLLEQDLDGLLEDFNANINHRLNEDHTCTYCGVPAPEHVSSAGMDLCAQLIYDIEYLSQARGRIQMQQLVGQEMAAKTVPIGVLSGLQVWGQTSGDWKTAYTILLSYVENAPTFAEQMERLRKALFDPEFELPELDELDQEDGEDEDEE